MPLKIDHVFTFCDPALAEVPLFEKQGLTVSEGRSHAGQGTANRCVMLKENYFELIYLSNEAEARANMLRLDRRAQWQTSGASPFGIGLRGELSDEDRSQFRPYHPPYASGMTIWIHQANEQQPELPLIFVVEDFKEREIPNHPLGSQQIESLIAFGPNAKWPLAEKLASVRFEKAPRPHLHLHIDGNTKGNFAINELCSFAIF